jgi:hypothetical protein
MYRMSKSVAVGPTKPLISEPVTFSWLKTLKPNHIAQAIAMVEGTSFITFIPEAVWRQYDYILVAEIAGDLAGILVLDAIGSDWKELGPVLVDTRYRSQVFLNSQDRLTTIICELLRLANKEMVRWNVIYITHNQKFEDCATLTLDGFRTMAWYGPRLFVPLGSDLHPKFTWYALQEARAVVIRRHLKLLANPRVIAASLHYKRHPKFLDNPKEAVWKCRGEVYKYRLKST